MLWTIDNLRYPFEIADVRSFIKIKPKRDTKSHRKFEINDEFLCYKNK